MPALHPASNLPALYVSEAIAAVAFLAWAAAVIFICIGLS